MNNTIPLLKLPIHNFYKSHLKWVFSEGFGIVAELPGGYPVILWGHCDDDRTKELQRMYVEIHNQNRLLGISDEQYNEALENAKLGVCGPL